MVVRRCLYSLLLATVLLLGSVTLAACNDDSALPTRAAAASTILAGSTSSLPGSDSAGNIPATYTALPAVSQVHHALSAGQLLPTLTPSAAPQLPSRTPTATPTITPTATLTPYLSHIPELPPTTDLGPSKMGLHVVRNNDPAIMDFVRRTQPAVVKAVDDLGFLAEVRAASPRTITVGRFSLDGQDYTGNPEEEARKFVARYLDILLSNPAVDYWEGWNEPDPNMENMPWYARFEQERVRELTRHGLKAAIGGFATGVPELDEFELFVPAVETAIEHGGILSLHEYGAPDMAYLYGDPLPDYPAYPDRGSLTFRYRWFYREILEPAGLVIPLVISEAGIDGLIGNRPGPQGLGWQDFQDYWVQQGLGNTGVEAFINQIAWYDAGIRQDGYVIGFTLFTAGGFSYWENYDLNPILPQLADYAVSQR